MDKEMVMEYLKNMEKETEMELISIRLPKTYIDLLNEDLKRYDISKSDTIRVAVLSYYAMRAKYFGDIGEDLLNEFLVYKEKRNDVEWQIKNNSLFGIKLVAEQDIPYFIGTDMVGRGPFNNGEEFVVPEVLAKILIKKGIAKNSINK